MNGKKLTDNKIEEILHTSTNNTVLQITWTASKETGSIVADDILRLVRMRNEAVHELGFVNYHAIKLQLREQNPMQIEVVFDELDELTKDIVTLARRYYAGLNIPIDNLIERSDLFEKEGKYQHVYCTEIDCEGDVRILWYDTF